MVEVYEKDGCLIDIWFTQRAITWIMAGINVTSWDIVTGVYQSTFHLAFDDQNSL